MDICREVAVTKDKEAGERFACLVGIVDTLRSERGCPWDREQTENDVKEFLLEEVHELISGISLGDVEEIKEEIGDVILLAVFLARIFKERGEFTISEALEGVNSKLIRRHPHVFGDLKLEDSQEVVKNWTRIKDKEKGERGKDQGVWASVPVGAPSLFQYFTYLKEMRKRNRAVEVDLEAETARLKELLSGKIGTRELVEILRGVVHIAFSLGINPEVVFLDFVQSLRARND